MRTLSIFLIFVFCNVQFGFAQVSVNPGWGERNGLSVASTQTVRVPATKLRGFTTFEVVDANPREAIKQVNSAKESAIGALRAIGVLEDSVKSSSVQILEWAGTPKTTYYSRPHSNGIHAETERNRFTAVLHLSFDISIDGQNPEELVLLPYDVCKALRERPDWKSKKIVMLYIGEIEPQQILDANKKAYEEALAHAKSMADLSGRKLGKLVELTPQIDGRWRYGSDLTYGYWNDETAHLHPMSKFRPEENEVFGTEISELARTYSIELRFEIE